MATVLLVEDQSAIGMALQEALLDEGYTVEWIRDGQAAVDRLQQAPVPGVVLLDLFLPAVGGCGVLLALRSLRTWKDVPVLLVTGAAPFRADFPPHALYQGTICKPFDLDELLVRVAGFLGKGIAHD